MPLNFPSSPSTNTTYSFNNRTWTYNGNAWALSYGTLNTGVVSEGSNLYFSNARVYANVSQLDYITSSSLSGYATNAQLTSYATTSNVALKANIADLTAANITGTTLNSSIVTSSLTSVGTLGALTVTGNVNSGAISTTGNSTAANYQSTGNVNTGNLRVTTNSTLGTVVSGTWNGTSIATTYTDAKIVAVSNTAPVSVTTAAGTATVGLLISGVSATTYGGSTSIPIITVDTYGRITSASNVSVTSGTTITDDTATNATRYLTLTASSSGSISTANVSTTKLFFNPSTGLLTSTDYNSSSDERLKKNIKTVENAVEKISALRGVTFDWKEGNSKGIGLIAQEVKNVLPDVVTTDENGFMGIKYTNIIGILVEAIKDQQEQINTLKKQIEKL